VRAPGLFQTAVSQARAGLRQHLPTKVKALSAGYVFTAAEYAFGTVPLQHITAASKEQHVPIRMLSFINNILPHQLQLSIM